MKQVTATISMISVEKVKESIMDIKNNKGLSASFIKTIALIFMFIDHFAASIVMRLMYRPMHPAMQQIAKWVPEQTDATVLIMTIYQWMRNVGRISFPIYCFFIVEGFFYTKSRTKYAARLALCALISELVFDLALYGKVFYFFHQNVFFTLLIGLCGIWAMDRILTKADWTKGKKFILTALSIVGFMLAAEILFTDYSSIGVSVIVVMYLIRKFVPDKVKFKAPIAFTAGTAVLCFLSLGEAWALLALPLMFFYKGKKGWNAKWFFYLFYPVHLLFLAVTGICFDILNITIF